MIIHGSDFNCIGQGEGVTYIHIPKVAGTSIEKAFNVNCQGTNYHNFIGWDPGYRIWMQHTTLEQIKQWWRVVVNNYFTFTFVRNPYDRAVSDWLWFKNDVGKGQSLDDPELQYDFTESTLMDYLLNENSFERLGNFDLDNRNYGYYWSDHSLLQYQYICDSDGNIPIQFIGRFENLEQDWMQLMKILTEKYKVTFNHELPHVNKTRSKKWEKSHYSEYYDDETREIATNRYSIDLELLNYTFEDITS